MDDLQHRGILIPKFAEVAQLVRAGRLYRQGYGFKPLLRYGSVSSIFYLRKDGNTHLKGGYKVSSRFFSFRDKN